MMTECWREDPDSRPSFRQLIDRLEAMLQGDAVYCDLSKHDESSPYYRVSGEEADDIWMEPSDSFLNNCYLCTGDIIC